MVKFIGRFIDFLTLPDDDDHFIIEKWRKESDQADRLKELHRQSRKQTEKSKLKKSLKLEDFESPFSSHFASSSFETPLSSHRSLRKQTPLNDKAPLTHVKKSHPVMGLFF